MYDQAYKDIGKGLQLVLIGEILAVAGTFTWSVLSAAGLVLSLVGLNTAGRGDSGYRSAFTVTIINLIVTFVSTLIAVMAIAFMPAFSGFFIVIVGIASSFLGFLTVYYICSTSAALLGERDMALSQRAGTVWKLYGGCTVASVVCMLLIMLPFLSTAVLSGGIRFFSSLVHLVASVLYLLFLYRASQLFQNW